MGAFRQSKYSRKKYFRNKSYLKEDSAFRNFNRKSKRIPVNLRRCGAVLFTTDNHVVMVENKYLKPRSVWGLPKGHIENNESYAQCMSREVYEETNLQIKKFLPVSDNDLKIKVNHTWYFPYNLRVSSKDIRKMLRSNDSAEVADVKAIPLSRLKSMTINRESRICLYDLIHRLRNLAEKTEKISHNKCF